MNLDEYLLMMEDDVENEKSYIDLSKQKELAYMEYMKYHFLRIFDAVQACSLPLKVLDIGPTPFTLFLKKAYPHYHIATIDRSDLMRARCEELSIDLRVCDLMSDQVPFDRDYFDIVIFTEVIEHLFITPTEVLGKLSEVLKKNGQLVLSTPNFARLLNRLKLVAGINPMDPVEDQMKQGWIHGFGHIREYTMQELCLALSDTGFITSKKEYISPPANLRNITNAFQLASQTYRLICKLIPPLRATIFLDCIKVD